MGETNRRTAQLSADAGVIIDQVLTGHRRLMLFGPPGGGKSTLAGRLADELYVRGRHCDCISADPGSPAFGLPGTLALARRVDGRWEQTAFEPLCTLDAGRFRLPLAAAVWRLVRGAGSDVLLIDSPGVVRGAAGSELLHTLVDVAAVDVVLAIVPPDRGLPLAQECAALSIPYHWIEAAPAARRPGKRARARARTAPWDAYLATATMHTVALDRLAVIGTPPPRDAPESWVGRQVALLHRGRCIALGEATQLVAETLTLRTPARDVQADTLLVRDAVRGSGGLLESAVPFAPAAMAYLPPAGLLPGRAVDQGPRAAGRVGGVDVALVNGLFGDPLLHVRMRHCARSLLFDIGDGSRLSARTAHQVTDVFISHAHMDHLGGFLWLLRSRVGELPACRLYGPPGLAGHIDGLIRGFLWDRVAEHGPVFEVGELHGDVLRRFRLQAGVPGMVALGARPTGDGVVLRETGFQVRAVMLDHHTPVMAYAFEPDAEINVRKDELQRLGLAPGPWLNALKGCITRGDRDAVLPLPDGRVAHVPALARELVSVTPGKRLVYATDLADTPDNRARLVGLARHAHTLFLEAVFTEADVRHACTHGHLTARACGEIAAAAGVSRLVPFHLSRRYADDPRPLFDEIGVACARAVVPGWPVDSTPLD